MSIVDRCIERCELAPGLSWSPTWALEEPELARQIKANPVNLARPKAPKPYQSESTKALSDEDLAALLDAIRAKFTSNDPMVQVVTRRDYALLLFYLLSGLDTGVESLNRAAAP